MKRTTLRWTEARARRVVYQRSGGVCEVCGQARATEWHHRKARSQGGTWAPSNGLHLCHGCHHRITNTRAEYYHRGWLVKSWADPALVAFQHHTLGVLYLDEAGDYHYTPAVAEVS